MNIIIQNTMQLTVERTRKIMDDYDDDVVGLKSLKSVINFRVLLLLFHLVVITLLNLSNF